jgi:hypothetical protein
MTNNPQQPAKPQIVVSDADQGRLTTLAMDALEHNPVVATELLAEMERALVKPAGHAVQILERNRGRDVHVHAYGHQP